MGSKADWPKSNPLWIANTKRLCEMIALHSEPYAIVEHEAFQRFVRGLQPR
jgi:hypothetical protein